jgi:hypothetical protein
MYSYADGIYITVKNVIEKIKYVNLKNGENLGSFF